MTLKQLKAEAKAKYETQQNHEVIFATLLSDFLNQYDTLIAKGYKKPDCNSIEMLNVHPGAMVVYMIKPDSVQKAELNQIYKDIEAAHKETEE